MIKKSLETAALVNYERLSKEAKIDGANQIVPNGVLILNICLQLEAK